MASGDPGVLDDNVTDSTPALGAERDATDAGVVDSGAPLDVPSEQDVTQDESTEDQRLLDPLSPEEKKIVYEGFSSGYSSEEMTLFVAQGRNALVPSLVGSAIAARDDFSAPSADNATSQRALLSYEPYVTFLQTVAPTLASRVRDEYYVFIEKVKSEFSGFPPYVQDAFRDQATQNGVNGNSVKDLPTLPLPPSPQDYSPRQYTGMLSYLFMRMMLWNRGYRCAALLYTGDRIKTGTFLTKPVTCEAEVFAALKAAEGAVVLGAAAPADVIVLATQIGVISGLQPRMIFDTPTVLSNHAFGRAVDIDPVYNPVFAAPAGAIVEKHSGIVFADNVIKEGADFGAIYSRLKGGSDQFAAWLTANIPIEEGYQQLRGKAREDAYKGDPDAQDVRTLRSLLNSEVLKQLASTGYLTIPVQVVKALLDAKFAWGAADGHWDPHRRDFMHFQMPDPTPKDVTCPP